MKKTAKDTKPFQRVDPNRSSGRGDRSAQHGARKSTTTKLAAKDKKKAKETVVRPKVETNSHLWANNGDDDNRVGETKSKAKSTGASKRIGFLSRPALVWAVLAVALSGFYAYYLPQKQKTTKKIQPLSPADAATDATGPTKITAEATTTTDTTTTTTTTDGSPTLDTSSTEEENECSVWIAPSSVKGVNGFGVFVTRDLKEGDSVLGTPDGTGIIVGSLMADRGPKVDERRHWKSIFDHYWWGRGVPAHVHFDGTPDVVDFQIGFGSNANHHCILDDLITEYPSPPMDDTLANRFHDPSAGSFSYNRGREFFVKHALQAGSELFLNYGHCDRGNPESPEWLENAYVTSDFHHAAYVIQHHKRTGEGIKYEEGDNLMASNGMSDLVASLIPSNRTEFDTFIHGISSYQELVREIAIRSLNRRSPEWIKANGMCMDNLIAKKSTLPLAGQGGFSQHTIRKGEKVAPAFLMQIIDKDALILYDEDENPSGAQLLLNYCFGHNESSMLLCPNTNAVLINHCSSRKKECGPDGPNAEYRWADWDKVSEEWRKMTIDDIAEQDARGLTFEITALRDIEPGDEVFFDYGEEWERAWDKHVETWVPPTPPAEGPWITAKEANEKEGPILDELISGDLKKTVDHPYLFTGCQYWESHFDDHPVYHDTDLNWEDMQDEQIIAYYGDPYHVHGFEIKDYSTHRDRDYWPCSIIRQEEDGDYTVRIHRAPYTYPPWHINNFPRLITNFPRESIHYFVRPLAGDQHLPGVFRHPIAIKDETFPRQWKNLKS